MHKKVINNLKKTFIYGILTKVNKLLIYHTNLIEIILKQILRFMSRYFEWY